MLGTRNVNAELNPARAHFVIKPEAFFAFDIGDGCAARIAVKFEAAPEAVGQTLLFSLAHFKIEIRNHVSEAIAIEDGLFVRRRCLS